MIELSLYRITALRSTGTFVVAESISDAIEKFYKHTDHGLIFTVVLVDERVIV